MRLTRGERSRPRLSRRRTVLGWLVALGGCAALTGLLIPVQEGPDPTVETMLFLTVTVGSALIGGLPPALVASLVATLSLNYFFTPPLHTLTIAESENALLLGLFVVVSVAVSSVVASAVQRRDEAAAARDEAATLTMLNRVVLEGESDIGQLLELVRETFHAQSVDLVTDAEVGDPAPADSVARGSRGRALVLRDRHLEPAERRILSAFATHLGVILDRDELLRQRVAARELEEGNRARTALLAAVSHDLRTPLAGIKASVGALLLGGEGLSPEDRGELVEAIDESSDTLSRIVADLLDMSRLTARAVEPLLRATPLDEVVTRALVVVPRPRAVRVSGDLPVAMVDEGLLERVLANLLTNAVQHSRSVEVSGMAISGGRVIVHVVDHGPGVPDALKQAMFEPFERVGERPRTGGVGLGLAVARGLTELQGGTLDVRDTAGGGLTVVLELEGAPDADPDRRG
ncbi:MAG: DUF4118 domain-containing protein [Nocardioidaceae bacterium]